MSYIRMLVVVATLAISSSAGATTFFPQKFVCPIGGEKFTAKVVGSMTSWGQRPDGRRYGTLPIFPITECPGNGFLYFGEEFSNPEVQRLTPLVLGAEYQSMRKTETPHYRAWWLADRLGRDPFDTTFMLLAASWEADEDPSRKTRYQQAFIEATRKLEWSEEKGSSWFWLNLRAANALRELGRFDESTTLLTELDSPARLPREPDEVEGARFLIDGLKQLNAENNSAREPANLIPAMEAADRCIAGSELSPAETKACDKAEVREAIERLRQARQQTN